MTESGLLRKIVAEVKAQYPRAFVVKLADRNTRGLPDLLIACPNDCGFASMLFVETKTLHGRVSPIQKVTHAKLQKAMCSVVVARDVDTVTLWLKQMGCVP